MLRRLPFTATVVALMLVLGLVTGTLWNALESRPLFLEVAYGLPAFQHGQWWTVGHGCDVRSHRPSTSPSPVASRPRRLRRVHLGTRRAAIAAIVAPGRRGPGRGRRARLLTGAPSGLGHADRRRPRRRVQRRGARAPSRRRRVTLRPPWRARLRCSSLYAVLFFLYSGVLWDLEHLIGVAVGLAVGPLLVGRRARGCRLPRATQREWRTIAALTFALSAVIRLDALVLARGRTARRDLGRPTRRGARSSAPPISLLLANGLRKGERIWRGAGRLDHAPCSSECCCSAPSPCCWTPSRTTLGAWATASGTRHRGRPAALGRAVRGAAARAGRVPRPQRGASCASSARWTATSATNAVQLLHRARRHVAVVDGRRGTATTGTCRRTEDGSPAGYVAYQLHQRRRYRALGTRSRPTPRRSAGLLDGYVSFWEIPGARSRASSR